ncbi:YhgE/Pip domain-containing protein [Bifidobacterium sp. ESL0763]|uniref:YhgE/Pip family protein n=1 Tax=Bifidobacterium sp. ESL0763 TaxID=2983227 RepID=UPI0023F76DCD|nr:YhgE/Pip domain-containing protein [Bifidobacterium sp. ESL0763]MDF7663202.1 YhgE/Pip domain-containing protein [Bifidobacterium sp. ESL0763]
MSTIWKLFTGDVRRITGNVISIIILIGLVVIPALFTWFNVTASWDPFGNSKNLKFAVASVDEGYSGDLVPVKMRLGDQVISQLRANSQLDWTFTTKDQAIEGTKSGKYYAAVVIPKHFSRDMMTFFSKDAKHATLTYYTNEKKNAVASKVTGQGADEISKEVNETFARTITTTALDVAGGLSKQLDSPDARQRIGTFNGNVADLAAQLDDAATNVGVYSGLLASSQTLLSSSDKLLRSTSADAGKSLRQMRQAGKSVHDVSGALDTSVDTLLKALKASSAGNAAIGTDIDHAFTSAGRSSADVSATMRTQAGLIGDQAAQYQSIRDSLAAAGGSTPNLNDILATLDDLIAQQKSLQNALNDAATKLDQHTADAEAQREQIVSLANQSKTSIDGLNQSFEQTLKPHIAQISQSLAGISGSIDTTDATLKGSVSALGDATGKIGGKLDGAKQTLDGTADSLTRASKRLTTFSHELSKALDTNDMAKVRKLLSGDSDQLAGALAAPVQLHRNAVFPVENFGTSLTPFYTFIPLWVGSLLMALAIKTDVSPAIRRRLGEAKAGWSWARRRRRNGGLRSGRDGAVAATAVGTSAGATEDAADAPDSAATGEATKGAVVSNTETTTATAMTAKTATGDRDLADTMDIPVVDGGDDVASDKTSKTDKTVTAANSADHEQTESIPIDQAGRLFEEPKPHELFLGRLGVFMLISLLQSTFSCLGTLLFLRVHVVHPLLFMLSGWVSGLVYAIVIYTLVACFGTIGKALTVIVLVMQISGSSGTYPPQVLPSFIRVINPLLPATHSIQAMRAAIAGIYQGDFWIQMGIVLVYAAVMLVIGLLMPKPSKFNRWFTGQIERTKLI